MAKWFKVTRYAKGGRWGYGSFTAIYPGTIGFAFCQDIEPVELDEATGVFTAQDGTKFYGSHYEFDYVVAYPEPVKYPDTERLLARIGRTVAAMKGVNWAAKRKTYAKYKRLTDSARKALEVLG